MKFYTVLFCLSFLVLYNYKNTSSIENTDKIWSDSELVELNEIVLGFDQALISQFNSSSIETVYLKYSEYFFQNINSVPVSEELLNLCSRIKQFEIFEKIWVKHHDNKTITLNLGYGDNSPYMKYLQNISSRSSFLRSYYKNINVSKDIQPSIIAGFSKNNSELNMSDINNRLIFAIHYLTLILR